MATHIAPKMATYTPSVRDTEIDLRTLLSTLGDQKKLILAGTACFFALSLMYVVLATPKYEANAVVQVERRTPSVPGLTATASAQMPSSSDTGASTEIQLLTSRRVLSEALNDLGLDIKVEPSRFPLVGNYVARHFSPGSPGAVAAPWLGLNRYGWGGERLQVSRLDVPDSMLDAPLTLVAGEAGTYALLDRNGTPLVDGKVGETAQAGDVTMTVSQLQANPGMRFKVTRLNSLVILDQLKQDISASEQGPVRPVWLHGSKVTTAVPPLARSPAWASATISACGPPA